MFTGKKFSKFATFAVSAAVLTFAAVEAHASHFRYGTMSWTRSQANPLEVTFNITEAWRVADSLRFTGGTSFDSIENRTTIGTFTDANSESYTVYNTSITRTFSSAGTFNLIADSCCRIGNLQNGNGNDDFTVTATVDLSQPIGSNVGSPVAQAPIIVPMPITTAGSTTSFQLPFADPDLEGMTVSVASLTQSGLSQALPSAPGGNTAGMTVSPTGLLEWDTSGTTAGQKFALQLRVDEDDSANSIPVDFIIEIGNVAANQAPTVDGATFNLEVGDVLSHTVTGNDPDNGPVDPMTWALNTITGPETVTDATFDPLSQLLIWDTTGYDLGTYTFFVSNFDGAANGLGQIIVNVTASTVSEPGMAAVLGLGLMGIAYSRRRKTKGS